MTRIIAGRRKGLHLHNPKNRRIRPTTDRVKEWIFSVLGPLDDIAALDLYCGAGNLGLEALSRNAKSCVFIDSSQGAVSLTHKNIERAEFSSQAKIVQQDCLAYLRQAENKYHLVFADPPYQYSHEKSLFNTVQNVLYFDAMFVYESDTSVRTDLPEGLENVREKKLGTTTVTMLRNKL